MKLFAIEGNIQKLDGGAMYGNAPREVWKKWSPPDDLNRITLACRGLLFETDDGRNILFETGIGSFFEDKLKERYGVSPREHALLENLRKVGVSDADIDVVVLSHMHFDHAGGVIEVVDGKPRLLFPKAKFLLGRKHWQRAQNPHFRDKASFIPAINELLAASGRLTLIDDGKKHELAPLVTFSFSDGHTPGLMISTIELPGGPLAFVADLIPALPWVRAAITMGYDRFPELLIDEKRALLETLACAGGSVFFTHDPEILAGKVIRDDKGQPAVSPVDRKAKAQEHTTGLRIGCVDIG
ncbi:hypothetical protein AUK22_03990 [bacterium CG2_30_54_10]|nr:MAG: hypothetical protein AUK22_03990 [bacterium CG2_30_54_10]